MKHAAFHYLDRDDSRAAFSAALNGPSRADEPSMQRVELTCWRLPDEPANRRLHSLGQVVTSEAGMVDIVGYHDKDGDHLWRDGDRLAVTCFKCRHDGRTISGSLPLTRVLTLSAWLAWSGPHPLALRRELRLPARADTLAATVRELRAANPYNMGRDEVNAYRRRLATSAGLTPLE